MADRRPPQRPAYLRGAAQRAERRTALRFPAFGISALRRAAHGRAALWLPAFGRRQRSPAQFPPQRGGKRVSGRFYVFLGIRGAHHRRRGAAHLAALGLGPRSGRSGRDRCFHAGGDRSGRGRYRRARTRRTRRTRRRKTAPSRRTPRALSDLLGSEDTEIAGLTDDQMVQVTDLSVNTSLSPEWQNILLLGVDQRVQGESCRSDTMIICSINTRDFRGQAHLADARHGRGVHRSGRQQRHLPPQRRQLLRRAGDDDDAPSTSSWA